MIQILSVLFIADNADNGKSIKKCWGFGLHSNRKRKDYQRHMGRNITGLKHKNVRAMLYALFAAVFYAANVPFSKVLLKKVEPTFMAALLYLGAGVGIGILSLLRKKEKEREEKLSKNDLPFVIGMIVLEEAVSMRLWTAIILITLSSILLSFEGIGSLKFSAGSLFVLAAAICWGFENNCTRKISSKSTYEIVILKGTFSGLGSLVIALCKGEEIPELLPAAAALLLGFVAYGLSIFLYVRAQNTLGAAKTSAYYAASPFVGAFLSFVLLREKLSAMFPVALAVMAAGSLLAAKDTLDGD